MPRVAPVITLNSVTDTMLRHLVRSPSTPQGLALRSRIVLAASTGQSNQQIAATLRIPEITAGKWRRAFATSGMDGLRDAPRAGRPLKHGPDVWERIQARACQQPEAYSRWTVRTLARDLNRERSRFVRTGNWTKERKFSSLRVPRRHPWVKTPGISSVTEWAPKNSISSRASSVSTRP